MRALASVAGFAAALLLFSEPLESQEIRGRVIEGESGQPVMSASVMLLDTTFTVVSATASNRNGAFLLKAPAPGAYYVLAEALGYHPIIDGILDLGEGGSITVALYLQPKPFVMDSILVAVERAQIYQHLEQAGFHERATSGFGQFITPEEIKRRQPVYFADLFRATPGVYVQGASLEGTQIQFQSSQGGRCTPNIFVDGVLVNTSFGLEDVVDIYQISAVEVYTHASSVPSQWGGTNAGCGVLLIWTR